MIARELDYLYIDSGAMYRAATLYLLDHQIPIDNPEHVSEALQHIHITFALNEETSLFETYINGENVERQIRTIRVANSVSEVSKLSVVRERMVEKQREIGRDKGIVMDGRDIGTVVFPDAELKVFMTADFEVRAQRRYDELKDQGVSITMDEVKNNLRQRDEMDSTRTVSPLMKAEDALVLDTSNMTKDEELAWVCNVVDERMNV